MRTYLLRRFIHVIPLIIGVSMISFFVLNLAPGDYVAQMAMNPDISPRLLAQIRAEFGLDQPVWVQYFHWLGNILTLNFGQSFAFRIPVTTLIGTRILNTLILSFFAILFSWIIAIPLGIHAAIFRYSFRDNILTFFAFFGISIPNFFLGLLLLYFVVRTGFLGLPIGGMTSWYYDELGFFQRMADVGKHLVLPVIVLGTASLAGLMRQMRGQMMDAMSQDYVRTARSKGLSDRVVIYKHALRNAINPLITIFGFSISGLLGGAALTEIVFSYPGLGTMMLEAVRRQDLHVAMAGLLMGAVLLIVGNLIADILLAVVDPRIRYD